MNIIYPGKKPLAIVADTNPTKNTEVLLKTLDNNGWDNILIGEGVKWEGFITKMKLYAEYLETIDPNRLCVTCDGRDVLCVRSPLAFETGFNEFNKPIVVSMELLCNGFIEFNEGGNCVELNDYWYYYSNELPTRPKRQFVNTGLIIGKAKDLLEMYNWCINWVNDGNINDDQIAMGYYMNKFPEKVGADYNIKLLHSSTFGVNCASSGDDQWEDSPSISQFLGHGAFFLHIPGIEGSKGNGYVYNMAKDIVNAGYNKTNFLNVYKVGEIGWKQRYPIK